MAKNSTLIELSSGDDSADDFSPSSQMSSQKGATAGDVLILSLIAKRTRRSSTGAPNPVAQATARPAASTFLYPLIELIFIYLSIHMAHAVALGHFVSFVLSCSFNFLGYVLLPAPAALYRFGIV